MSYQQKNVYVSLFNMVIVMSVYYWWVSAKYHAGVFDGPDGASEIGKSILMMVGAGVVVQVVGLILFSIIHAIITKDPKPSFLVDERDRLIELRAARVTNGLTGVAILLTFIALALGWSLFAVFHVLIIGGSIAAISEAITKLALYRRGY